MAEMNDHTSAQSKKVDEAWKEQVEAEKKKATQKTDQGQRVSLPEPDLNTFVSSLAAQTLMALGQIENPLTKKKETDLNQARYTIDILRILKDKTKGNLTEAEDKHLQNALYNLQMSYVQQAPRP